MPDFFRWLNFEKEGKSLLNEPIVIIMALILFAIFTAVGVKSYILLQRFEEDEADMRKWLDEMENEEEGKQWVNWK